MAAQSPLYDVSEAAAYIRIKPGTLRNWLSAKRLAYVKVGRLTFIPKHELDRYLDAHTVHAVEEDTPCAVQLIGGWTSLRMVERYCHVTDNELHKAVSLASTHTTGTNTGTAESEHADSAASA